MIEFSYFLLILIIIATIKVAPIVVRDFVGELKELYFDKNGGLTDEY